MELFKYEFRRSLKKPVTILIVALIFFLGINMFNEMRYFNDKIKYNREISHSDYITGSGKELHEKVKQIYVGQNMINEVNLYDGMTTYAESAMNNFNSGKFQEAFKDEIIVDMIFTRLVCDNEKKDEILRDSIEKIWNELLPEINYDYFTISQTLDGHEPFPILELQGKIIDIKYRYDLYSKNIKYIDNYSLNNVTFTYNMIDKYFPFILAIFIVLTTFNCISDEYRTGVVKNIATQSIRRSRYYITMIFANFLSAVIVIASTMVVLNLIVGFSAGFQSLDTPILSHENQWNSITTKAMDLERSYLKYGNRVYLGPTEINYDELSTILYEDYKLITFKTFLAEATGVYLLFGFFITALTVFISSIFADKMKALIVLVILLGIGYFTAYMSPSIFNVFSTSRVTQIITGSSNLTLLGSFIVLGISTLITVLVGLIYFRRKDITY